MTMSSNLKLGWTFGIICGPNRDYVRNIIESIKIQNIEKNEYEIILVGDSNNLFDFFEEKVKIIHFDENERKAWITRKKNLIAQNSSFDKISMHHDYVSLDKEWFVNFQKFGNDWDVAMTRIENLDSTRFRDWVTWIDGLGEKVIQFMHYEDCNNTDKMYVSGSYFCVKTEFLLMNQFNEDLCWGEGEDVEWSKRIRSFWKYRMNYRSIVRMQKMKHKWPPEKDPFNEWYLSAKEEIK